MNGEGQVFPTPYEAFGDRCMARDRPSPYELFRDTCTARDRPSPYEERETQRRTMKIRINGEDKNVNAELTLYELLLEIGLEPTQPGIAVAVNREVVPQAAWNQKKIDENSEVEIIRAVQGG